MNTACRCCGESNPAFLYVWVDNDGRNSEVLCANCNLAITRYGVCPHQKTQAGGPVNDGLNPPPGRTPRKRKERRE